MPTNLRSGDGSAKRVGLLGFGEVGQVLANDLSRAGITGLIAYDVLFADPASQPSREAATANVSQAADAAALARDADIVICAVTAANDQLAAQSVATGVNSTWYLDLNSASPGMKQSAAAAVDGAGGRYVEAAVMSPISPKRIASPMLLGGPHAAAFVDTGVALGFSGMSVFADTVGPASATKMCRSVIVKGIEALLTESMLSARHYGVQDVVLDSLSDLFPLEDWNKLARYMISRSIEHGVRRAEEMQEVARTVEEAGIEPLMALACIERQQWAPRHRHALEQANLNEMLDAILADNAGLTGKGKAAT